MARFEDPGFCLQALELTPIQLTSIATDRRGLPRFGVEPEAEGAIFPRHESSPFHPALTPIGEGDQEDPMAKGEGRSETPGIRKAPMTNGDLHMVPQGIEVPDEAVQRKAIEALVHDLRNRALVTP